MSLKEPALKDVIVATQADLRANPEHANAIFAALRRIHWLRENGANGAFILTRPLFLISKNTRFPSADHPRRDGRKLDRSFTVRSIYLFFVFRVLHGK